MSAKDKITKARSALILDHAFFGSLLLRLELKEDNSISTMATNGKALKYNSDFVISLPMDQLKGVLIHEILHCTFEHMARRGYRSHYDWNRACDYAINPIVYESGFTLPDGCLFESAFKGKSADEIYSDLMARKQQEKENNQNDSNVSNGQNDSSSDQDNEENGNNGQNSGSQGQGNGQGESWQIGEIEDAMDDNGNSSQAANTETSEQWKIATIQAHTQAKAMGSHIPDAVNRMVESILHPKLDWKEMLRRFVQNNARNDYSWSVPNRRHIAQGLYLPGIKSEELGKIVLAIDTSGSVSENDLNQFSSELSDILEQFPNVELTVLYCDTDIRNVQEFTSNDLPLQLEAKGFGGTDFRPPFRWVTENDLEPIAMIYFTDGYCNRYPEEPEYSVLWIGTVEFEPRFGEFAYLF